jgi:hypothetical protein
MSHVGYSIQASNKLKYILVLARKALFWVGRSIGSVFLFKLNCSELYYLVILCTNCCLGSALVVFESSKFFSCGYL